jgi:hypothetical protein
MCMTHSESTEIQDILIKTNLSELALLALTAYKVFINQQLPDFCLIFCTVPILVNQTYRGLYTTFILWVRPVLKVQEK